MSTICGTIAPYESKQLDAFMERRRKDLNQRCKTRFRMWRKGAFEVLQSEFFALRVGMQEASLGGAIEYAFVLAMIADYISTHYGRLTPDMKRQQLEIYQYVKVDSAHFERRVSLLPFTQEELSIIEELQDAVNRLYSKLHLGSTV